MTEDEDCHIAQVKTGVTTAPTGWRVVLTNEQEVFSAPVVLWVWSKRMFRGDHSNKPVFPEDAVSCLPIIPFENELRSIDGVLLEMPDAGTEWRYWLVEPGGALDTDPLVDPGWEEHALSEFRSLYTPKISSRDA